MSGVPRPQRRQRGLASEAVQGMKSGQTTTSPLAIAQARANQALSTQRQDDRRDDRGDEAVDLAAHARERVVAARATVERLAAASEPIYGLNSALGANTGAALAPDDLAEYQLRAIRARAVAVGAPYDRESVRAMLFARIAGMAQGGSGASPSVLDGLCALLNHDVVPVVPRIGSISVADLPQLAHLALVLVGVGDAYYRGERVSGRQALARAGLEPVTLGAKDGVALISANAAP